MTTVQSQLERVQNTWGMTSMTAISTYAVGKGFLFSRTSGKAVRGGWSCQPATGQDENLWAMRLSEMATTCHKMASETTWWPLCMLWEGTSCSKALLGLTGRGSWCQEMAVSQSQHMKTSGLCFTKGWLGPLQRAKRNVL